MPSGFGVERLRRPARTARCRRCSGRNRDLLGDVEAQRQRQGGRSRDARRHGRAHARRRAFAASRVDVDVPLARRRRVARAAEGAAHQDVAAEEARERGLPLQRDGEIRERPEGHERDLAGSRSGDLDDPVRRVVRLERRAPPPAAPRSRSRAARASRPRSRAASRAAPRARARRARRCGPRARGRRACSRRPGARRRCRRRTSPRRARPRARRRRRAARGRRRCRCRRRGAAGPGLASPEILATCEPDEDRRPIAPIRSIRSTRSTPWRRPATPSRLAQVEPVAATSAGVAAPRDDDLESMGRERPGGRLDDLGLARRDAGRADHDRPARAAARARRPVPRGPPAARDRVVEAQAAAQQRAPREQHGHERGATSKLGRQRLGGGEDEPGVVEATLAGRARRRDVTPRPSPRRWRRCRGRGWWARGRQRRAPRDRHRCPRRSSPARGGQRDRRPSRRPPRRGGVQRRSESCPAAYRPAQDGPIGSRSGSAGSLLHSGGGAGSDADRAVRAALGGGPRVGSRHGRGRRARRGARRERRPDLVVEHIGSTSVPGLPGKGIVDLSIETTPDEIPGVVAMLYELGFGPQPGPDPWPPTRPMPVGSLELDGTRYRIHLHVQPRRRRLPARPGVPRRASQRPRAPAPVRGPEARDHERRRRSRGCATRTRRPPGSSRVYRQLGFAPPPISPPATIGILGGGQLGRMLGARGARDGLPHRRARPGSRRARGAPSPIGSRSAAFDDVAAAQRMAAGCAVVTYELEHVGPAVVAALDDPDAADPARPVPAQAHRRPARRAPLRRGQRGPRRGVARGRRARPTS